MRTSLLSFAAATALAVFSTGCIKTMVLNGTIESTRTASSALDTVGDLELVESAAQSGLVQFEGMHKLAPNNTDALFMLTKGWVSYGYGFIEDELEGAQDAGDSAREEHEKQRGMMAYERAVTYGLELLSHHDKGFANAKKNDATMRAWLNGNFKNATDAEDLFWVGYAWLARTSLSKDDPAVVADLWIGVDMLERSVEIDPAYMDYSGMLALASYHARSASAEMDDSKKMFETVLAKTNRTALLIQFGYATRYACAKQDPALYEKLLVEVLKAPDSKPDERLKNAIAKKRAKRWLTEKRMFDACSMDATPHGPAAGKK